MIKGSIVAIVTPMFDDGSLDKDSLRKLIDWHVAEGTDGIVIVGTTGESATVSPDEHVGLIQLAVEHVAGRVPVIAGSGKRLFADGAVPAGLSLVESTVSTTGVVIGTYRPAGAITVGSFALED